MLSLKLTLIKFFLKKRNFRTFLGKIEEDYHCVTEDIKELILTSWIKRVVSNTSAIPILLYKIFPVYKGTFKRFNGSVGFLKKENSLFLTRKLGFPSRYFLQIYMLNHDLPLEFPSLSSAACVLTQFRGQPILANLGAEKWMTTGEKKGEWLIIPFCNKKREISSNLDSFNVNIRPIPGTLSINIRTLEIKI